jgi:hypothetical protein
MRLLFLTCGCAALLLAACKSSSGPDDSDTFSLNGTWLTLETETNLAKTKCSPQFNLVLRQDGSGVVSGSATGNASTVCQKQPKTAIDSAQARSDPFWGTTIVTLAPITVSGFVSGSQVSLDLRTPAWHFIGTGTTAGETKVTGTSFKRDKEFPADSAYSGTFWMTKIGG